MIAYRCDSERDAANAPQLLGDPRPPRVVRVGVQPETVADGVKSQVGQGVQRVQIEGVERSDPGVDLDALAFHDGKR